MRVAEVKKALFAGGSVLVSLEGLAASLDALSTHPWVHAAAVGLSGAAMFGTWILRNKLTIEQVFDAIEADPTLAKAVELRVTDGQAH